jgi:hypothetical protein
MFKCSVEKPVLKQIQHYEVPGSYTTLGLIKFLCGSIDTTVHPNRCATDIHHQAQHIYLPSNTFHFYYEILNLCIALYRL